MTRFQGTIGNDRFTGTAGNDQFSAAGGGSDQFTDTAGGSDAYLIYRADTALYFAGDVTVIDRGGGSDRVDITDFVLADGARGLGFAAEGADLAITSGSNRLVLAGQLAEGSAGVETLLYSGATLAIGDLTDAAAIGAAVTALVRETGRGLTRLGEAKVTVGQDGPAVTIDLASYVASQDGERVTYRLAGTSDLGKARIKGSDLSFTPDSAATGSGEIGIEATAHSGASVAFAVPLEIAAASNAPPVAKPDSFTLGPGQDKLVLDVLANDLDPDGNGLRITEVLGADHVDILRDGTLRYTREPGAGASDRFSYQVSDGNGETSDATVVVRLALPPEGPVAVDDGFSARSLKQLLKGLRLDPLKNDSSPLGAKGLDRNSLEIEKQPDDGSVTVRRGKLVYMADDSFDGDDSFSYSVADSTGQRSDTASIVISGPSLES